MKKDRHYELKLHGNATVSVDVVDWDEESQTFRGANIETSGLKTERMDEEDVAYNSAIDGLEELLMTMAAHGIELQDGKIIAAINNAVEGIANNT